MESCAGFVLKISLGVAPTEDESGNFKCIFFVVLVFVYSKGVVVRIKMPLEVARITCMVSRGWGLGRKFCCAFISLQYNKNTPILAPWHPECLLDKASSRPSASMNYTI